MWVTIPNAVAANKALFFQQTGLADLYYCHQIHSAEVIDVHEEVPAIPELRPEADALVSARCGVTLGIFTADCVPVFILDVATPAIGIVHAGWRGTLAGIAVNAFTRMETLFGTLAATVRFIWDLPSRSVVTPSAQNCSPNLRNASAAPSATAQT